MTAARAAPRAAKHPQNYFGQGHFMALRWMMRGLVASLAVLASSASRVTNMTWPTAAAVASQACVVDLGTHAGALLADMTIADLGKKNGGAWNSPEFARSSASRSPHKIEKFQNEPVLKIFHPRNHGSSGQKTFRGRPVVKWGIGFSSAPRGLPGEAAVFEYDVFFERGWPWSRGGKMHGLAVGHGVASGGRRSATSASFRVMWQPEGGAIAYLYLPYKLRQDDAYYKYTGQGRKDDHTRGDGTGVEFGTGLFRREFEGVFRVGEWNHVEVGIKLNSFDAKGNPRPDGTASLVINGNLASFDKIKWRGKRGLQVESAEFTTFAGGPDPAWADGWQYFKGFGLRQWQE